MRVVPVFLLQGDAIILGSENEMIKKGSAHNQKKLDHSFSKIRADKF